MVPMTEPHLYLALHHAHADELRRAAAAQRTAREATAGRSRHRRRLGTWPWRRRARPLRAPAAW